MPMVFLPYCGQCSKGGATNEHRHWIRLKTVIEYHGLLIDAWV